VRTALLLLVLAACSSTAGSTTPTSGPQTYGIPEGKGPITEHAVMGGTVYVYDVAVYGPCDLLKPHEDNLAGWLGIDPPDGYADYGMVCTG